MTACPKCGQEHTKCAKHRKHRDDDGNLVPCGGIPMRGQDCCRMHGGTRGKANAERRLQEAAVAERIAEMLADYQPDVDQIDLHGQLLEVVALTSGMRRALTVLVGELASFGTPAYVEYPVGEDGGEGAGKPTYRPAEPAGIYGPDHQGDGKPHVLMEMLRHWTVENAKATKLALDAGIDERRVQIQEQEAEVLARGLRAGIALVIEAVGGLVDDAAVVRALNAQLPSLMRKAIEQATQIIDTTSEETDHD